ncbi:MAG: hypothetical protein IJ626_04030 [Muribaculaceae bacterium]|nr:hypothetical protein [Muribaculaceae bacterium]
MKRIPLLALVLTLMLTACHTTEENYKRAYDIAKEKRIESIGAEEYAKIEAEKTKYNTVIAGDSVRLIRAHANVVDMDKDFVVPRYCVVVAEFNQVFNATSYAARLRDEEHLPSFVLKVARDKNHVVVVKAFDEKVAALSYLKSIDKHVKMKLLATPWILEKL